MGISDAFVIGLGSMIGAGIFAALAPAARAAGSGLLIGLALAAVVGDAKVERTGSNLGRGYGGSSVSVRRPACECPTAGCPGDGDDDQLAVHPVAAPFTPRVWPPVPRPDRDHTARIRGEPADRSVDSR
jgi:hypothetical protein